MQNKNTEITAITVFSPEAAEENVFGEKTIQKAKKNPDQLAQERSMVVNRFSDFYSDIYCFPGVYSEHFILFIHM